MRVFPHIKAHCSNRLLHISVCSNLARMIDAGTPPDYILDTTRTGRFSEAVKSFSKSLGIPTITTSYGATGYLRLVVYAVYLPTVYNLSQTDFAKLREINLVHWSSRGPLSYHHSLN